MEKYITILLRLKKGNREILGKIVVRDSFALSTFGDPELAKQLYEYDLKAGEDVAYSEQLNAYIKKYPNMKKAKIVEELTKEIKNAGGEII